MSMEQSSDEIRRSTIVSRSPGLAYERMREVRRTHFSQPLASKLTVQGGLFVALAAALSLTMGVGGETRGATVGLVTLGTAGGALVVAGATAHAVVGACRLRFEPLTEREALALLTVEDAASYLGIASGGLVVAVTVVAAGVEVLTGAGPATGTSALTGAVMAGAMMVGGLAMAAGRYLEGRLPRSA